MPRKKLVSLSDEFVKYVMMAPLAEVTALLKTATTIVTVRAQQGGSGTAAVVTVAPLKLAGRPRGPRPKSVETLLPPQGISAPAMPAPPVNPPTPADKVDLAAARDRANQAAGLGASRDRRLSRPRPAVSDGASVTPASMTPAPPVPPAPPVTE